MIDRMYQFDDSTGSGQGPSAISRRNWVCARGFELVHSSRVAGRTETALPLPITNPGVQSPSGATNDFMVSVLREDWPAGGAQCRLRVRHAVAGAGPLTVVMTGPPVPLVLRLELGDCSAPRQFFPVRIDLEIRRGGQAPGSMALPRFPLQAGASYTIVLAEETAGSHELLGWSEAFEHAE